MDLSGDLLDDLEADEGWVCVACRCCRLVFLGRKSKVLVAWVAVCVGYSEARNAGLKRMDGEGRESVDD